jgi:hypothetical protein
LSDETLIGDPELHDPFYLDLTEFFDNAKGLRQFVPSFHGDDEITCGSFLDPTFGGILPGFEQDPLANLLGLEIQLSGEVTCSNCGSGSIFVGDCWWYGNVYNSCSADDFTVIGSPGAYRLFEEAGEELEISAFLDRDGNAMLSPGDYYGEYAGNPFFTVSVDCSVPGDVNVHLSEEMIGIKGAVTNGGEPVADASVSFDAFAVDPCQWNDRGWYEWTRTDESGHFAINGLEATGVYVYIDVGSISANAWGWWDGNSLGDDCNEAVLITPSAGDTIIDITLP